MDAKIAIVESLRLFLAEAVTKPCYKQCPQDFTRKRSLTMEYVALLIVSALRRTLDIELVGFFKSVGCPADCPTKGAFSQARYKLSVSFFRDWNACFCQSYYSALHGRLRTWRGLRVEAVDGSQVHLPDETFKSDIGRVFGVHRTVCMGLVMTCCDVLQNIVSQAVLCPFRTDERWVALRWLKNCRPNVLRLYDRGFASAALMYWHLAYAVPFVMRLKLDFNTVTKQFVKSGLKEQTVFFAISWKARRLAQKRMPAPVGEKVKVRLVRVELPNGGVEVLATSLYDAQAYPAGDFAALYFMRWGSETIFDRLKNVLQLQLFAARRAKGIQQEFQATILLLNLQSLLAQDCQPEIDDRTKKRKYKYQINHNLAFGHLKEHLVSLFSQHDPKNILHQLKELLLRQLIPIKPDRNIPRQKRKRHLNTKHFTPVNYRKPA